MNGSSRSIAIKKNIIASLFLKGISILVSLQVVPLTINYINPTRYGIWIWDLRMAFAIVLPRL